ncbi:hypothetical protein ACX1RD_002770 [Enterococcus faecalis]|uniref:hypothetical protein n=1 Tax=Enterococcus TaxID=1350 RepID=UPI001F5C544E|nr:MULTISPECIES: hypothetical protein [Enterococcus]MDA3973182.1 hypothetical protein [Enterococcus thailandicus]MDA3980642.1 hypothetical protein [Enterococcus thailandicus]MDT2189283.1 hypothetical protein [Enterococcus faecalis]
MIYLKNEAKEGVLRQELLDLINKKGVKQSFIVSNCNISKQHLSNYLKKGYNISDNKKSELKNFLEKYYI